MYYLALRLLSNQYRAEQSSLTCFEDLVAQREARSLVGVVRDESDLEGGAGRDDGRWGDVAAVSTQDVGVVQSPITDLDEVIPDEKQQKE